MTMIATGEAPRVPAQAASLRVLRAGLDQMYFWSGRLAAAFMVAILVATVGQVFFRYVGINLRGLTEYAGYFMAASTFLALADTLNAGVHIRIETFSRLLGRYRHHAELWAFGCTAVIAGWFAYYSCNMVYWSYVYDDVSTGMDALPLWIPQMSMAIGTVFFAVAIADQFLQLAFTGKHSVAHATEVL